MPEADLQALGAFAEQQRQKAALPQYKCHKVVRAAKIVFIDEYLGDGSRSLTLDTGAKITVFRDSQFKNTEVGDYYVVYDDNYASRSPAKAFEEGYAPL